VLLWHGVERILLVAFKLEHVIMILPESVTVAHCNQSYTERFHVRIKMTLYVNTDSTRALI